MSYKTVVLLLLLIPPLAVTNSGSYRITLLPQSTPVAARRVLGTAWEWAGKTTWQMAPGPVLLPAAILWKGKWKMELFWKPPPPSQIWLKSADWFENHGGEGNGKVDRQRCTDWMIIRVLFLQESKLESVLKVSSGTALTLSSLTSLIFWFYHCIFQLKKFSSPFLCNFFPLPIPPLTYRPVSFNSHNPWCDNR